MKLSEIFRLEVKAYLRATGMAPTLFGRKVVNDPSFVAGLRNGRSPTVDTVDKVRAWIAKHPPAGKAA